MSMLSLESWRTLVCCPSVYSHDGLGPTFGAISYPTPPRTGGRSVSHVIVGGYIRICPPGLNRRVRRIRLSMYGKSLIFGGSSWAVRVSMAMPYMSVAMPCLLAAGGTTVPWYACVW